MIKHLVYYSGGIGSWASAKRLAQNPEIKSMTLLFADTLIEDEDLYRFLNESVENLKQEDCDINYVKIAEGRTPWEVFEDVKFIGNSRIDPCSRVLKREFMDKWRDEYCDPGYTTLYYGIDWTETHRLERVRKRVSGWKIDAPMTHEPLLEKSEMLEWLIDEGIEPPRLYKMGFPHNNCGGFCVKAGQAQFKLLHKNLPHRYAYHEKMENQVAKKIGTDARILRDRRNKQVKPLSLTKFRERIQDQPAMFDKFDFGGCGCALD